MVERYPGRVTQVALDSALRQASEDGARTAIRRIQEFQTVKAKLAPHMHSIEGMALDAAGGVDPLYRLFLNQCGIACDGINGAGLVALADQVIRHKREGGLKAPPVSDAEIRAWEEQNGIPHRNIKHL